jgi:hypothetical protein
MFELPSQHWSIVLEIANVQAVIVTNQDDDDTEREITLESEHAGDSTLPCDIEDDDLDIRQEVLHLDQTHSDKIIRTKRVLLPNTWSRANTVITLTPLPNLRHPVAAIAPQLLKRQKSAINLSPKSDVVQALPLPKAGGDHTLPQPKASGDHNVPQHQKAYFDVAKRFMEAIVFTKTPWPIISEEKYSMVDEAWKLAIEAQGRQQAIAGSPVGTSSVCQSPSGPSHKIDPQTREAVRVYSVFCSSIGLLMILNPKNYILR